MRVSSWDPLGAALLDYHHGDHDATLLVRSTMWEDEVVPMARYYRPQARELPDLEVRALGECRGRVLDLGAGGGRHALELQRRGVDVRAVDSSPEAVTVMRLRGVRDASCHDLFELEGDGSYDTLLLLMNGLGVVGDLAGLGRFLRHARDLLAPGGQILCDSADLRIDLRNDPELVSACRRDGSYLGDVDFQLSYRGLDGESYPWLFADPDLLDVFAATENLSCETLSRGARGSYLARLEKR